MSWYGSPACVNEGGPRREKQARLTVPDAAASLLSTSARDAMSRHGSNQQKGSHGDFNMTAAVRRVVVAAGFEPDLDSAATRQLDSLTAPAGIADAGPQLRS